MLTFDSVALRYDRGPEILRDISFALAPGSFHFLTGASGAGKSTLLKLMALGLRPSAGRISLFGRDPVLLMRSELPALRRKIGIVFQDFHLIPHLSVLDNVALPLLVTGGSQADHRRHAKELLAWVGLGDHTDAFPATLSGGQQQRVAIARAVVSRPSLLLADEPTGNVDDAIGLRLMYLFEELNRLGTTLVIATHNEALTRQFPHPRLHLASAGLTRLS